jgi:type I restriction-modification system DNA methylase subunit
MKNMNVKDIKNHIRNRSYMSGIERNNLRIKATGEVFTPTELVQEILDKHPKEIFMNKSKTICDPFCGDGQFLGEVLIRKIEHGIDFEQALSTIYGVDIMQDNVNLCRERILCGQEHLRPIVERNIVCADALKYHYRFDGSDPYKTKQDLHIERLFSE